MTQGNYYDLIKYLRKKYPLQLARNKFSLLNGDVHIWRNPKAAITNEEYDFLLDIINNWIIDNSII